MKALQSSLIISSFVIAAVLCIYEEERQTVHYEGRVGGFVVFNCHLEFPNDYPIPYSLLWRKDVSTQLREKPDLAQLIISFDVSWRFIRIFIGILMQEQFDNNLLNKKELK